MLLIRCFLKKDWFQWLFQVATRVYFLYSKLEFFKNTSKILRGAYFLL